MRFILAFCLGACLGSFVPCLAHQLVFDHFERPILLFPNSFTLNYFTQKHKDIELVEALSVNSTFNGK